MAAIARRRLSRQPRRLTMYLPEFLNLGAGFEKYFSAQAATDEQQRRAVYRIRHEVYCDELGYEPSRPDRLEKDAFDDRALHCLLRSVANALAMPLTELIDPHEGSVEKRLIRRFLDGLPAHRLEDVVFRLMRDYGEEAAARRKRLALVGLRGAGKTTLGSALAAELATPFVELDREIELDAGISLSEIFLLYGQAGYRRIERRCLERLVRTQKDMVMTVGGGIVSEPETYNLLLQHCFTIWIKASPDEHMSRVAAQGDLRPMQGHSEAMDDLKRILEAREPLYRKADLTLDTAGDDPQQSLSKLRQAVLA